MNTAFGMYSEPLPNVCTKYFKFQAD
uniref:Uncharacterized protein n=1 Tax=Tetranychus urticae TaxID=32264 RepID=T1L131_TETUR